MFSRLYMKMAFVVSGLIATTLLAVMFLFYFTLGKPLARDIHAMLKNHTRYLGTLVRDSVDTGAMQQAVHGFVHSYGFHVTVFDEKGGSIVSETAPGHPTVAITPPMFRQMNEQGIFIQRGHFGRPLIYMFPVKLKDGTPRVVVLARKFSENRLFMAFPAGLAVLGFFLLAAVYPLSRHITGPLTVLSQSLERIARGEFHETPENEGRNDEIGGAIRLFNHMSRSVEQMIQSKKQLLADISHELCSPLARIRVGTELIKDSEPDEKTLRCVRRIENDIECMDHLVMNLSTYSKMNLPGFSLSLRPFSPEDLIRHVEFQYRFSAEKKQIHLECRVQGILPITNGDFEQLKRVFSNLLDNALRHTEKGGRVILGALAETGCLVFYVEDNGPGVPEVFREKIFEPLFRVDVSRNQDSGGSGLGLAISKRIVELHGGTLECTGEAGATRFTFRLPLDTKQMPVTSDGH